MVSVRAIQCFLILHHSRVQPEYETERKVFNKSSLDHFVNCFVLFISPQTKNQVLTVITFFIALQLHRVFRFAATPVKH